MDMVVEQNYDQAFIWYQKAAEQNYPEAQFHLGVCYSQGLGTEKDLDKAKFWYQKSGENGYQLGFDEYKKLEQ